MRGSARGLGGYPSRTIDQGDCAAYLESHSRLDWRRRTDSLGVGATREWVRGSLQAEPDDYRAASDVTASFGNTPGEYLSCGGDEVSGRSLLDLTHHDLVCVVQSNHRWLRAGGTFAPYWPTIRE